MILLFGMPRSGTTWIGKIFDSHPDTLYLHEPDSWGALNAIPLMPDVTHCERYADRLSAFTASLRHQRAVKVRASLPLFPKHYYSTPRLLAVRGCVWAAKGLEKLAGEFSLPHLVNPPDDARAIPVWKSIESLGRIGCILRAESPAKAIHLIRHPCGYVASILRGEARHKFTDSTSASEDYGLLAMLLETEQARRYDLSIDAFKKMTPVERLAWRWVVFNEKAMDDVVSLSNARMIRYEDLCDNPLGASRNLFDFCELEWSDQTEAFIRASTTEERSAYYTVFKNPARAAVRWTEELSKEGQVRVINVVKRTRIGAAYGKEQYLLQGELS